MGLLTRKKGKTHRRGTSLDSPMLITGMNCAQNGQCSSAKRVRRLLSFVPRSLDIWGWQKRGPFVQEMQGCVLFIDIANFTSVADQLCEFDERGPERLAGFLNGCFSQVVRLVSKAGGDVLKFAGDAVICFWPVDEDNGSSTLAIATQRAVQCGLDIQETFPSIDLYSDLHWSFKIGVGCGEVSLLHLGGVEDQRDFVALGDAVLQAFKAEKLARPHKADVICSNHVIDMVSSMFEWEFSVFEHDVKHDSWDVRDLENHYGKVTRQKGFVKKRSNKLVDIGDEVETEVRARLYVPQSIWAYDFFDHAEELNGLEGKDWVSESRQVTVLFIHLGFPLQTDFSGDASLLQEVVCEVQQAVFDYEGVINKISLDDKGITAIAVFGLAPLAHSNDATRGVLASLRIVSMLESIFNLEPSVGVTSDLCFCGIIGHCVGRKEFTVIGDSVNLAARLMQSAKKNKTVRVLTDERTRDLVRDEVEFLPQEKLIKVKGKEKKIKIFSPSLSGRSDVETRWSCHHEIRSEQEQQKQQATREILPKIMEVEQKQTDLAHHESWSNVKTNWREEWKSQVSRYGVKAVEDFKAFRLKLIHAGVVEPDSMQSLSERIPESDHLVTVITGDIGSGKSYLLAMIQRHQQRTKERSIVLSTAGNPFEKGSLARRFAVWIDLIQQKLVHVRKDPVAKMNTLVKWLRMAGSSHQDHPELLEELFDPSSSLVDPSKKMRKQKKDDGSGKLLVRNDEIQTCNEPGVYLVTERDEKPHIVAEMIVDILRGIVVDSRKQDTHLICLIDDAMYMDSDSWRVIPCLIEKDELRQSISIVLALQPLDTLLRLSVERNPGLIRANDILREYKSAIHFHKMRPLSSGQVATLMRSYFDVLSVPDEAIDVVTLASLGNPLFVEEILREMLHNGTLEVDRDKKICNWGITHRQTYTDMIHILKQQMLQSDQHQQPGDGQSAALLTQHPFSTAPFHQPEEPQRQARFFEKHRDLPAFRNRDIKKLEKMISDKYHRFLAHESVNYGTGNCIQQQSKGASLLFTLNIQCPRSLSCIMGAWLNRLSLRQQLILKLASFALTLDTSHLDTRFHKHVVIGAALLIDHAAMEEEVQHDFEILEALEFVRPYTNVPYCTMFSFVHWMMPHVLRMRTLSTQRLEIFARLQQAKESHERAIRNRFLNQSQGKLSLEEFPLKEGMMFVHKRFLESNHHHPEPVEHQEQQQRGGGERLRRHGRRPSGILSQPWKRRYVCLHSDRIDYYTDESKSKKTGCTFLKGGSVLLDIGPISQRNNILRVNAKKWLKQGKTAYEQDKDFLLSPLKPHDVDDWLYKLRFAIESTQPRVPKRPTQSALLRARRHSSVLQM